MLNYITKSYVSQNDDGYLIVLYVNYNFWRILMEQQQEQQMGIEEEEEEKQNNQIEMVSEEPIDEERNDPINSPSPVNVLEGEDLPGQMEEEKVNQDQRNEEISVENEVDDNEAISEEVEDGLANDQINQNQQELPQNDVNFNEEKPGQNDRPVEEAQAQSKQSHFEPPKEIEHAEQYAQAQNRQEQLEEGEEGEEIQQGELAQQNENARQADIKSAQQIEAQVNAAQLSILQKKKAEENIAYTNKIERLVENLSEALTKSKNEEQILRKNNIAIAAQLKKLQQNSKELRMSKMNLEGIRIKLVRDKQQLQRQNADFKEKLTQIQKIGNILVLQSTIQELRLLTSVQKDEIEHLKTVNTQQAHSYYQQQFNLLQSYQNELNAFREQTDALNSQLQQAENEKTSILNAKLQIQKENASLKQTINALEDDKTALRNEISSWQKKWESFEDERAEFKRTRELDQKVSQYESERFMGEDNDVQIIPTLSDKEEKNLLLKEYLMLEALYEESKTKQEQAEIRLKRVLRDSKVQEANVIRKKDYQDLLSRYRKAKTCLQGAFARLKNLERVESCPKEISQEVNELLEGNESRLCQTIIKKTNEQHQLISDKINQMEQTDQILTLKKQNTKFKENQIRLEKQLKNNEKILYLMNDELEVRRRIVDEKSKIIERLINAGYHHKNNHYDERIAQLQRQLRTQTENLSVFQIKSILLIKQNESYLHQINHWKCLYSNIKDQLSQKIAISLTQSQKPIIQTRMETQSYHYCKECEKRSLDLLNAPQLANQCVQTQNNYDLHYKEIKQSLLCLKKINKQVEAIPESHQKTIRLISEFKDKYEKYIEKYNGKLLELKKEKAENEAWRTRAKQEIRDEFQDIRDIIGNNRLATALRQAKSLIDYLENEQEKGQEEEEIGKEENGKEEMEEENEGEQK